METTNLQETSDSYSFVVKTIDDKRRIIRCKDNLQYISQIRTGGNALRPWRGISFFQTKAGASRQSPPFLEAALSLFSDDSPMKPSEVAQKPVKGLTHVTLPEVSKAALRWATGASV